MRELELREKELELKEYEMNRQRRKDEAEQNRKESLAGQTKFYGDALKYSLPKMSNDRLRMKLARTGIDEEAIATAERTELLNMYAEYLLLPPGAVGGGTTKLSEEELALRRSALELK